jgi:hypothetical protein
MADDLELNPTPETPTPTEAPASVAAPSAPDGGGLPGGSAPAQSQASLVDYASQHFPEFKGRFQDDASLLNHLLYQFREYQRHQPYIQAGAEYYQHRDAFQDWKKQQATQQAPQQKDEPWWKPHWSPPEFDQSWKEFLTVDEQGNVVTKPGAPPDLAMKYTAHQHWQRQQAQQLLQNPYEFMDKGYAKRIEQLADARIEQFFQKQQQAQQAQYERQQAQQFVQQNSSWLHQPDPLSGQPVLAPQGQQFAQVVSMLNQPLAPQQQAQIAQLVLAGLASQRQAQAAQGGDVAKQALLGRGHAPNHSGSMNNGAPNGTGTVPQNPDLKLMEKLNQRLASAGINGSL